MGRLNDASGLVNLVALLQWHRGRLRETLRGIPRGRNATQRENAAHYYVGRAIRDLELAIEEAREVAREAESTPQTRGVDWDALP